MPSTISSSQQLGRPYELDLETRALLGYVKKLTETPGAVDDADFDALRAAGWDERGIYQANALISFFNFSGRMEAASGLPMDGPQLGETARQDAVGNAQPQRFNASRPSRRSGPGS